jgi:uncharacterized protein
MAEAMVQIVQNVSPAVVRERIHATPEEIAALCRAHNVRWLALFGSVLRDDFTDKSDIDAVVAFGPPHSPDYWGATLWGELSALFGGRKAEMVNYRRLNWRFRDRILVHAETVYGVMPEDASKQRGKGLATDEMTKDYHVYTATMLDAAREVTDFTSSKTRAAYDSDEILQHASAQCVTQIERAAQSVSPFYRDRYPDIPWGIFVETLREITYPMDAQWRAIFWNVADTYFPSLVVELENIVPPEMQAGP